MLKDLVMAACTGTLLGVAIAAAFSESPLSQSQIYDESRAQTFRVLNPQNIGSGGTGFMVNTPSGARYLLTNAHVCQLNSGGFMVAEREGTMWGTSIVAVSNKTDLCLLQPIMGFEGLEVAGSASLHEELYIVGHPHLNPVTITHGFSHATGAPLINYCMSMYGGLPQAMSGELNGLFDSTCVRAVRSVYATAAAAPGNSGSPTLNVFGKVVGVLFAGDYTGESLLVPLEDIQEFLKNY